MKELRLETSPERDNYIKLRLRYLHLGEKHRKKFITGYATLKSADELFERLPEEVETSLAETASMVADDLAANGIFDVGMKRLSADLHVRADSEAGPFNRVQDKYYGIIGKAAELEAQRQEARDNRGQVIGGGFGVEGAVGGMVLAAVANAAIGLTYGLANLTANAASKLGDNEKKQRLLSAPATKADLGDFFVRVALQGAELVAEMVNSHADTPPYTPVSDTDREKSAAIVENVLAGRVPENEIQPILIQALTLDPFDAAAWTCWLDRFGDQDGSIAAAAVAIGVNEVETHKAKLVSDRKASLAWSNPEECQTNCLALEEYAQWLGVPFDAERSAIESKAARLDLERRTFNGTEYPSLAEVTAARKAHEDELAAARAAQEDEARRTVAGTIHETQQGADEARAHLRDRELAASHASSFFGWLVMPYRRCLDTKGRSTRKEFFMFILCVFSVLFVTLLLLGVVVSQSSEDTPMSPAGAALANLLTLFFLASAVAALTLQIRRFHDQDRSGWFVLLNLIPYIGWLIVFAFMFVDGTAGDNKYGPDPEQR